MAPKKEMKGEPAKVQVTITIPFETPRLALIASQVLSADRNPKDTTLVFGVDESNPSALKFTVESRDVKLLRTAVTSVMESIQLVSDEHTEQFKQVRSTSSSICRGMEFWCRLIRYF
ncbi:hypothetical protein BCR33DRAFT_847933, partial [Rhizoclosmatium globosum]